MNNKPSSPRRNRRRDIARYGIYSAYFTDEDKKFLDGGNAAFCDTVESAVRTCLAGLQSSLDEGRVPPGEVHSFRVAMAAGEKCLRTVARIRTLPDI